MKYFQIVIFGILLESRISLSHYFYPSPYPLDADKYQQGYIYNHENLYHFDDQVIADQTLQETVIPSGFGVEDQTYTDYGREYYQEFCEYDFDIGQEQSNLVHAGPEQSGVFHVGQLQSNGIYGEQEQSNGKEQFNILSTNRHPTTSLQFNKVPITKPQLDVTRHSVTTESIRNTGNIHSGFASTTGRGLPSHKPVLHGESQSQSVISFQEPVHSYENKHKHVFVYAAPDQEEGETITIQGDTTAEKHYKILFIKAPGQTGPRVDLSSVRFGAPDVRILVYVLQPKQKQAQVANVQFASTAKPSPPQVFFIKYDPNRAQKQVLSRLAKKDIEEDFRDKKLN